MKNQLVKALITKNNHPLIKFLDWVAQFSITTFLVSLVLIVVIGTIDFITGFEFSVSFLYIFPVILTTWAKGWRFGIASALFAAIVWSVALYSAGFPAPRSSYPIWNTFMRFCVLATVGYAFSFFKRALETEIEDARYDHLTGIANRRGFLSVLEAEINRSNHSQTPFSVAFLDLDNFKKLNDTVGHGEGDHALRAVGIALQQTCRKMDLPARIGGDEFALLLPETDETIAKEIIDRFRKRFALEIQHNQWALGVSIGIINSRGNNLSAEQILNAADSVMYKAKRGGKNQDHFKAL
jgi:diguanylate cyclase (GGDEF)-like protein